MSKAKELAEQMFPEPQMENYDDILEYRNDRDWTFIARGAFVKGYEQAIIDMQESFKKLQLSTECAIDAVTALKSLLDNPDIREKLGKSKPIPKKPIKTNPFFGGEKK